MINRLIDLFEPVRDLFNSIKNFIMNYPYILWVIVIVMVIILTITFIAVAKDRHHRHTNNQQYISREKATVFVPVDNTEADINVEFHTLQERIIKSSDHLDRKLVENIKNKGPKVLGELIPAYDKATVEIRTQIKQLVKDERMLERYSLQLNRKDYPMSVILESWRRFPNLETMKEFVELLANPDETVQLAGARLLSAMHDPQMLSPLTAALMWPEHFIPARVAEVFASMGTQGASLLALLLPKVEDKHKVRILDTIAKIEACFPIEQVKICLQHDVVEIRAAAALALGAGRMTEAQEPLMAAAEDPSWQVRAAVAKALGMVGDRKSLHILEVLANDAEGWVAASAKESLHIFSDT